MITRKNIRTACTQVREQVANTLQTQVVVIAGQSRWALQGELELLLNGRWTMIYTLLDNGVAVDAYKASNGLYGLSRDASLFSTWAEMFVCTLESQEAEIQAK